MSNKKRLDNYLIQILEVFNNNGPKFRVNNEFITRFTDKITDREIEHALNNPAALNDIVRMLIKKISNNSSEPDWFIVNSNNKQFFIPSDEAIDEYNITGPYYNDNFEIEPLSLEQKSRFGFFKGGKKSKRRRRTKRRKTKSYKKRRST